jgi:[acyl-carrier-protein] S-malonyltransferase
MEACTEKQESPKTAYVFPGQGAQFVGMGLELYSSSRAAKELFEEVDDILSIPLSRLIFEGPDRELEQTINSQPAIMATSLACLEALKELDQQGTREPAAIAGHSLGEYTSLVVCGALDLADGVRLVRERGRLMQEASEMAPGSMAAILGLDEVTIDEICLETGAEIANINGGDQIVISGSKVCVARAVDMASIRGARKAIPLPVSGAFHSSLMSSAREGLAAAIEEVKFRDPVIPIIANSTFMPLTTSEEVKDELLTQLCSCVQWKKSVGCMIDSGVSGFIEFGPGKVLGGMIKRISSSPMYRDRRVEVLNVADLASVRKVAEAGVGLGHHSTPAA